MLISALILMTMMTLMLSVAIVVRLMVMVMIGGRRNQGISAILVSTCNIDRMRIKLTAIMAVLMLMMVVLSPGLMVRVIAWP